MGKKEKSQEIQLLESSLRKLSKELAGNKELKEELAGTCSISRTSLYRYLSPIVGDIKKAKEIIANGRIVVNKNISELKALTKVA